MKKLILIFAIAISASLTFAQEQKQDSTKVKRKAKTEKQYQLTKKMLENKDFVLESYILQDRYGMQFPVSRGLNFIQVMPNNEAVIQTGSDTSFGPNGVGGITAKGKITNWEINQNEKNKTFHVAMNVMTPVGIYDINFSISSDGRATALLSGLRGGRLTFNGNLVPGDCSMVYEGWSIG